tara:strand:- start:9344 stop:10735 length:1392 start_codon:yes stop_codon:yes gene_type:complete
MAKVKEQDVIQAYMSKMDAKKYLSKIEEQRICKIVQDATDRILETCLPYPIFRKQLIKLKESVDRNSNKILKILKHVDEETSKSEVKQLIKLFDKVILSIENNRGIKGHVKNLNFTNSTILNMVNPIKEAYREYIQIEEALATSFNFLELESDEDFDEFVQKAAKSKTFLEQTARSLYTKDVVVSKHIRNIIDLRTQLEAFNAMPDYKDIKKLHSEIEVLESEVQVHRNTLIEANLPLVISRAKKFIKSNLEFEDLIQEGNIGLIKAVDKFEHDKGFRLTTYATWWIDQAIRRGISNKSAVVRIPIHIQDRLQKINKAYFMLLQKLGKEPTLIEITKEVQKDKRLKIDLEEVTKIMTSALHEVSLDTTISEGISINDVLVSQTESPIETTSKIVFQEKLRAALALLQPKYEKVIRLRFGIGETSDHTLEEIGQHLGLTKERIRQIEKRALGQMSKKKGIKDGF